INAASTAAQLFRSGFTTHVDEIRYGPAAYEACISAGSQAMKTGALQRLSATGESVFVREQKELLVPADTWFTQEVIADGPRIIVKVNAKVVAEIDETKLGERGAAAPRTGHLGLRVFGAGQEPFFQVRKIEVKELPPGADRTSAVAAGAEQLAHLRELVALA